MKTIFAIVILCISTQAARAEIAVDSVSSGSVFQQSSVTVSHTCTGSNLRLFVGSVALATSTITVTGVTYNGSATGWAQIDSEVFPGDELSSELWSGPCETGTHDIVVSYSGIQSHNVVTATSFTGVAETTPIGTPTSTQDSIDTITGTVSSVAGELVVDFVAVGGVGSVTVGAEQSQTVQFAQGTSVTAAMSTASGAASVDMDWSWTGSHPSTIIGVSIKPAASGASIVPIIILSRNRRRL